MIDRPQNKKMRDPTNPTFSSGAAGGRKGDGVSASSTNTAARAIREFTDEMPLHQSGSVDWEQMLKQVHDQTVSMVQKYPATCLIVGFVIGGVAGWLAKRQK